MKVLQVGMAFYGDGLRRNSVFSKSFEIKLLRSGLVRFTLEFRFVFFSIKYFFVVKYFQ